MKIARFLLRKFPLTLLCLALIVYLSLVIDIPETPLDNVALIDKWTHFVMYGGSCAVMWWEYLRCHQRMNWPKMWLYAIIGMMVLGGVIEILQPYVGRSGEWLDFVADAVGVLLGAGIGMMMKKIMWKEH